MQSFPNTHKNFFYDSNSIAKNYLRISSTAAYIEPPA
jgi:hypothetical protein